MEVEEIIQLAPRSKLVKYHIMKKFRNKSHLKNIYTQKRRETWS